MKSNNGKLRFLLLKHTVITFALSIAASQAALADSCKAVDKNLAAHYKSMRNYSNYYGNNDWDLFKKATANFYDVVASYISLPNSISCELSLASATGVNIQTSMDGKFRTLSWDELNGGTMHHFDGLIQFQSEQTDHILTNAINRDVMAVKTIKLPDEKDSEKTIYMLIERGIYSNIARSESINLYEIKGDKLIYPNIIQTSSRTTNALGFEYSAHSPNGPIEMPFFRYEPKNKVISFPVVIKSEEYIYGEMTNRLIKYQFKDGLFRKLTS